MLQKLLTELLITGRIIVVVDRSENSRCYATCYSAESNINWRFEQSNPIMAVFAEEVNVSDDGFEHELHEQFRVYDFDENDALRIRVAMKKIPDEDEKLNEDEDKNSFEIIHETYPSFRGETLKELPVFAFNSIGLGLDNLAPPPLVDLANISLSHYRTSADLENGRHFTSLPQGPLMIATWQDQRNTTRCLRTEMLRPLL